MAIGAKSYGSTDEVAALTPRFADPTTHLYTASTRPTLAQVEKLIDRVSGILNVLLAEQGFSIPVTQADAKLALDQFVVAQVADLCNFTNSAGRFFDNKKLQGGPFSAIMQEAEEFIKKHMPGLAALGATQTTAGLDGLDYRETNDAGDDIEPMFSRKQFNTRNTDWDT